MRTSITPSARSRRGSTLFSLPGRPSRVAALQERSAAAEVGFGPHLVFDGHGCPAARLRDLSALYALLEGLPDRIGMTRIMPPYVFRHDALDPGLAGLSGFVLIAESHISVHAFPARRYVNVDVFSCEPFDPTLVLAELRRAFAPRRSEWRLFDRGLEFPKNIGPSRRLVMRERSAVARGLGLEVSR
jgi:S-adenosylmethionine decarboxylase